MIEYQKRGLPHAHVLLWLDEDLKPREDHKVNSFIRAEIYRPNTEPDLHKLLKTHMIHGPCEDLNPQCVCIRDGQCSKDFPKNFQEEAIVKDVSCSL